MRAAASTSSSELMREETMQSWRTPVAKRPKSHLAFPLRRGMSRPAPFSDAEIKSAFRAKALEYHPDQNQDNKETAEAKFKEIMASYEAIKEERKN
ncbi:hypothetical protein ZIOFF_071976 [Zingiber officinale]|uniref:J domain-containing protein n=1 Tax=Zingiber officinale TaxID=94328 RepID=A0A8J5ETS4_ZINOF|nr:hypothetical protein ZIOFF_071976 [Zingiber officinale]